MGFYKATPQNIWTNDTLKNEQGKYIKDIRKEVKLFQDVGTGPSELLKLRDTTNKRRYHLVHANIALARAPLDNKIKRDFLAQVEEIDFKASLSPGFVSQPTPSDIGKIYNGDFLLNMSIWKTVGSLDVFTHSGHHAKALKNRFKWFKKQNNPNNV